MSGSFTAWAMVEDLDTPEWIGTIGEIRNISPRSGLHTIRIGEGERSGQSAVVEVVYNEAERAGTLIGRTPFRTNGPHSD